MPTHRLLFLLPLAALCLPAGARQAAPVQQAAAPGMVVVRDAQTGELRAPMPAEARALQPRRASAASAAALPQPAMVAGPGGRRSVQLGERHLVYSVVTRGADGKLTDGCVHGEHGAEQALQQAAHEEHRHERR